MVIQVWYKAILLHLTIFIQLFTFFSTSMIRHSRLSFISDVQAHSIVIGMDGNKQHCLFYFWLICKINWRKFIWENLKKKSRNFSARGRETLIDKIYVTFKHYCHGLKNDYSDRWHCIILSLWIFNHWYNRISLESVIKIMKKK